MNNTDSVRVLSSKDILPLILSSLNGLDILNARLVSQSWNDAALDLISKRRKLDLRQADFSLNSDKRLFSSLKLDRFDLTDIKLWKNDSSLSFPHPQVSNWEETLFLLQNTGIKVRQLTYSYRGKKDFEYFAIAANRKLFVNLEKLHLIKEKWEEENEDGEFVPLEEGTLNNLTTLSITANSFSTENWTLFLTNLLKVSGNLRKVQTFNCALDLSGVSRLQDLDAEFDNDWEGDNEPDYSPVEDMLGDVSDRLVSLSFEIFYGIASFTLPVFPQLKKLKLGTVFDTPDWPNWFPALEALNVYYCGYFTDKISNLEVVNNFLEIAKNGNGLKNVSSTCFSDYKDSFKKTIACRSLFELASDSLAKKDGTLCLFLSDPVDETCSEQEIREAEFCWETALNSPVSKLILNIMSSSYRENIHPLQSLLTTLNKLSITPDEENRAGSVIEFVLNSSFHKAAALAVYPHLLPETMGELAKRWGLIRIRNLKISMEARKMSLALMRKYKLPVEFYEEV